MQIFLSMSIILLTVTSLLAQVEMLMPRINISSMKKFWVKHCTSSKECPNELVIELDSVAYGLNDGLMNS